jgi:hypothetical protein
MPVERSFSQEMTDHSNEAKDLAEGVIESIFNDTVTDGPVAERIRKIVDEIELKEEGKPSLRHMLNKIALAVVDDPSEMTEHERDRRRMFAGELTKTVPQK